MKLFYFKLVNSWLKANRLATFVVWRLNQENKGVIQVIGEVRKSQINQELTLLNYWYSLDRAIIVERLQIN